MAVSFPPFYTCQILGPDGKPVAGGLIRAYLTGTETPAPLFAPDGTPLGSSVSIDAAGNAVFCLRVGTTYRLRCIDADGAVVWTRDGVRALGETAGIENPMSGAGDMIVGAAGGEPARLAPGNDGDALKIVGGVPTWSTDQTGMANPMTTAGDLIVGTTGGEPDRLGVGADGDILASALFAGELTPTWEAGPKKYRNVYGNIPSPQIDDGYLGCLFYLSTAGQTLTLPATATIPSKSFIDFVFLDDAATLTITPQGTTTLNAQGSAVTIGGKSATLYRLTFLGHGGSGDEWALGGSVLPDGKVKVDAIDSEADYLRAKIHGGTLVDVNTEYDGSGYANIRIDLATLGASAGDVPVADGLGGAAFGPQTGDHQLLVSATDAAAGYLGAKLTAGSNVTLTPQTDGDGVQTLEISATGGGGGGGVKRQTLVRPWLNYNETTGGANNGQMYWYPFVPDFDTITGFGLIWGGNANTTPVVLDVAIYEGTAAGTADKISSFTRVNKTVLPYNYVFFDFDSDVNIDITKQHWIAVCASAPINGATGANLIGEEMFIQNGSQNGVNLGANYYRVNATPTHLPTSGVSSIRFRPSVILVGK